MCTSYSDIDELTQDLLICNKLQTNLFYGTLLFAFLYWFITH